MASKSYGWDVRNIAKISPKMAKKQSFFDFFFDFLKNCPYDSNEIFYSHSTPYYGPLCAISLNSYGWDVRNIAKISPKRAKKTVIFRFFSIFSQTVHTIRTKASQKEKDLSRLLYRICGSGLLSVPDSKTAKRRMSSQLVEKFRASLQKTGLADVFGA